MWHGRRLLKLVLGAIGLAAGAAATISIIPAVLATRSNAIGERPAAQVREAGGFQLSKEQWASLTVETSAEKTFRSVLATDGKIAVDEDHATPIFSPYAGRVVKLFAKAGDLIEQGQPLFAIEAADMVQGQNDFLASVTNLNKAKAQLQVSEIAFKRNKELLQFNAVARRDYEQAEAAFITAQNDLRSAEALVQASRNRLVILGKSEAEIDTFGKDGHISSETVISAPLKGTVVQRKVGPGQFVGNNSSDPVFVVGDLSRVWLIANVRESDAAKVRIGQAIEFALLAAPDRVFKATVSYVSPAVNPDSRRLQARAEIPNPDGTLKPEMFANVGIVTGESRSPSLPRNAVLYEGDAARVWVVRNDRSLELRQVRVGLTDGGTVQVLDGLRAGENVVTHGGLFVDRSVQGAGP